MTDSVQSFNELLMNLWILYYYQRHISNERGLPLETPRTQQQQQQMLNDYSWMAERETLSITVIPSSSLTKPRSIQNGQYKKGFKKKMFQGFMRSEKKICVKQRSFLSGTTKLSHHFLFILVII